MLEWYRNAGVRTFHAADQGDWIRTGRALCGADISRAGFVATSDSIRKCKRCERKWLES